jgi:hypothetical protein
VSASDALDRLARDAARFADEWPRDGAHLIQTRMESALRADTGGDGRFSHSKMGAGTVDARTASGGASVAAGGSNGVWTWLEDGTRGHTSQAATGHALRTPYGPRQKVKVGGMKAKRTWSRNIGRAVDEAAAAARQRLNRLG